MVKWLADWLKADLGVVLLALFTMVGLPYTAFEAFRARRLAGDARDAAQRAERSAVARSLQTGLALSAQGINEVQVQLRNDQWLPALMRIEDLLDNLEQSGRSAVTMGRMTQADHDILRALLLDVRAAVEQRVSDKHYALDISQASASLRNAANILRQSVGNHDLTGEKGPEQ